MLEIAVLTLLLIFLTAVFSVIESAIIYIDELRLAYILQHKPTNESDIRYVIHHKDAHLSSIVILITLISIAGSSAIGAMAGSLFEETGLAVFTGLLTYGMLVFAKVLPKLIAVQFADRIMIASAGSVRKICFLLKPLLWFTLIWARLFKKRNRSKLSRSELKFILKHFGKSGVIGKKERKMAQQVLDLDQRTISEIPSTPLEKKPWIPADATLAELQTLLAEQPDKRYIVTRHCKRGKARPCGVVLYRHIAQQLANGADHVKVESLARQVAFLDPETSLLDALQAFEETQSSIAILDGSSAEKTWVLTKNQIYRDILQVQ
ncbi:CNNM domain-containing protein [Endozoicomonadaceae bacterium StTr2]